MTWSNELTWALQMPCSESLASQMRTNGKTEALREQRNGIY